VTVFTELSNRFEVGSSRAFPQILKILMNEREAKIILTLPGTAKEIAAKIGKEENWMAEKLRDLYMRGLIIAEAITPEGPIYNITSAGKFMDLVLFDPRYDGEEFLDLWKSFYHETQLMPSQEGPSDFRVLPLEETIKNTRILPYEQTSQIIKSAKKIVVQTCACRKRERNCDAPLETCISLDGLAEYVLKRGLGKELTQNEALKLLKDCEKRGLIHQTANNDHPDVLCNCCPCCCAFLRAVIYYRKKAAVVKSRFRPQVDPSKCKDCLKCTRSCYFSAMINKDGRKIFAEENCYGCGLCAAACPNKAIEMVEVFPREHIPEGRGWCPSSVID
jgi:MinD superfamily P-loop ATPase containing an inserted ferredoxin domain